MNFSFETTAGAAQSTNLPILDGNKIHEVIFKGIEERDIQGVKDASLVYKVLDIKFTTSNGYYTETVWEPKAADFERRKGTNKSTGAETTSPSNVENMMLLFKHIIDAVNPELGKQIDNKEKKISAPDWLQLRKLMIAATEKFNGTPVKIKLIKNNKGESRFPYFSMLTKEAPYTAVVAGNFIGDRVYFSAYEKAQIDKAAAATPTNIANVVSLDVAASVSSDLDFNL